MYSYVFPRKQANDDKLCAFPWWSGHLLKFPSDMLFLTHDCKYLKKNYCHTSGQQIKMFGDGSRCHLSRAPSGIRVQLLSRNTTLDALLSERDNVIPPNYIIAFDPICPYGTCGYCWKGKKQTLFFLSVIFFPSYCSLWFLKTSLWSGLRPQKNM